MGHNRDLGYVKAFGKHLKKLGLAKSLSQEELSYKCGFALSQTGQFERGERNPTLNTIKILAEGLDEEPSKLLKFKSERGSLLDVTTLVNFASVGVFHIQIYGTVANVEIEKVNAIALICPPERLRNERFRFDPFGVGWSQFSVTPHCMRGYSIFNPFRV